MNDSIQKNCTKHKTNSLHCSGEPKIEEIEYQILAAIRAESKSHRLDRDGLVALNSLVSVYLAMGRVGDAMRIQEILVELQEKFLGSDHPTLAHSMQRLAQFLSKSGSCNAAERSSCLPYNLL